MTPTRARPIVGLATALALWTATAVAAQDTPQAPLEPTPEEASQEERLQNMQARMQQLRESTDPRTFVPLMEAQMADMEAMMKTLGEMCPRMTRTPRLPPSAAR